MSTQCIVAGGQIRARIPIQIVERRRQTVAAMLAWCAAQRPERILQSLGEGHVALAAEDHVGMFETGVHQSEVIEAVIQGLPGHPHPQITHLGKIRQSHLAGLMDLTEHDLLLWAMLSAPGADASFQRTPNTRGQIRMATLQLLEDGDGPQAWSGYEHRNDFRLEDIRERIGPASRAREGFLRGQSGIVFEAIRR